MRALHAGAAWLQAVWFQPFLRFWSSRHRHVVGVVAVLPVSTLLEILGEVLLKVLQRRDDPFLIQPFLRFWTRKFGLNMVLVSQVSTLLEILGRCESGCRSLGTYTRFNPS